MPTKGENVNVYHAIMSDTKCVVTYRREQWYLGNPMVFSTFPTFSLTELAGFVIGGENTRLFEAGFYIGATPTATTAATRLRPVVTIFGIRVACAAASIINASHSAHPDV